LERDQFICQNQGCGNTENLHVHHKIPKSKGGLDIIDNLISLCDCCHKLLEPKREHDKSIINRTKVFKTNYSFKSLSTIVPMNIVRHWQLKKGDQLDWDWKVIDDKMHLIVSKVVAAASTNKEKKYYAVSILPHCQDNFFIVTIPLHKSIDPLSG
jgi:hypothetical protein